MYFLPDLRSQLMKTLILIVLYLIVSLSMARLSKRKNCVEQSGEYAHGSAIAIA